MREIKFRCWEENEKVMYENIQNGETFPHYLANAIVMQYTGLRDKNGKEIYEGDWIKDAQGDIREMIFEDGGFWLKYPNGEHYRPNEEYREIVGNIYENSDLLASK